MPFTRRPFRAWLLGHVCLLACPAAALAADETAASQGVGADTNGAAVDIIVTASRHAERLLKVPYDITAVSGSDIEAQNFTQPNELLRTIPGVSVVDRGTRNSGQVDGGRIRGINVDTAADGDFALSAVSPLSTYIDDTPVFANLLLKDLDRVEILRGPQATLYGSGSLGGTIRYIQNQPRTDAFSGKVTSIQTYTANSDGVGWNGDLTLNVPITDTLAFRGTISRVDNPGFIDYRNLYNLGPGGLPPELNGAAAPTPANYHRDNSANDTRTWYGHAAIAWTPTEELRVTFDYNKQNDHTGGRQSYSEGADGFGRPYDRYENGAVLKEPSARDVSIEALEASYDFGFATLTSSTSYYDHRGESVSDNTGFYSRLLPTLPVGFLYYFTYFAPNRLPTTVFRNTYSDRSWIEEVRLASNTTSDDEFEYVAGFYFQDQNRGANSTNTLLGFQQTYDENPIYGTGFVAGDRSFFYKRNDHYQDRSGFGELTWHPVPRLSITGGVRYFSNESDVSARIGGGVLTVNNVYSGNTTKVTQARPLGKGNISYTLDDNNLVYGTVSQGYRRGGSNAIPITGPQRESPYYLNYGSDSTVNYEIGGKGILDGIRYDVALFWIEWSNTQLPAATPGFGYYAIVNAPHALSRGIELQLSGHVTPEIGYNVGYSYTDAFLTKNIITPHSIFSNTPFTAGREGTPLPAVPTHSLSVSLDHTLPLGEDMALTTRVLGTYQSESLNTVTPGSLFVGLDAYTIWNVSTTLSWRGYDASLFIKNIFNAKAVQSIFTNGYSGVNTIANFYGSDSRYSVVTPLTVGLTLSYKF